MGHFGVSFKIQTDRQPLHFILQLQNQIVFTKQRKSKAERSLSSSEPVWRSFVNENKKGGREKETRERSFFRGSELF